MQAFFLFFDHFYYFLSTLFSDLYFIYFGSFPSISTYILSITCFLSDRSSFYVFQIKIKKYYTDLWHLQLFYFVLQLYSITLFPSLFTQSSSTPLPPRTQASGIFTPKACSYYILFLLQFHGQRDPLLRNIYRQHFHIHHVAYAYSL